MSTRALDTVAVALGLPRGTEPAQIIAAARAQHLDAQAAAQLRAQRAAVLALHYREDSYVVGGSCSHCRDIDEDLIPWPCPTARALGVTDGA